MKKIFFILSILLTTLLLTSCNVEIGKEREGRRITITQTVSVFDKLDDNGEALYKKVIVENDFLVNPKKVVTYNLGVADIFSYIGLEKLGIEKFGLPKGGNPLPESLREFDNKKYADTGTLFLLDKTVLDLFDADLIILDGRSAKHYEELKKDYPNADILDLSITTYSYETQKNNFHVLGQIFEEAKDILDEKIKEYQTNFNEISLLAKDFRALFIQANGKGFSVGSGKKGRYGLFFNEFGFLEADPNGNKFDENSHGGNPSNTEYLKDVNPEVIFIMDRNQVVEGTGSDLSFLKDPLVKDVLAIKNENVYMLHAESWYTITGGIKSTSQMISDILAFISKVNWLDWQKVKILLK